MLRDSLAALKTSFRADHEALRAELGVREERLGREARELKEKYVRLVEEVRRERERESEVDKDKDGGGGGGLGEVRRLREECERVRREVEERIMGEVSRLRGEVDREKEEGEGAVRTARYVVMCFFSFSFLLRGFFL